MSLLEKPTVTALVQARTIVRDPHGSRFEPVGEPVPIAVRLIPVSEAEITSAGLQVATTKRFLARTWPGDFASLITIDGAEYEPVGDPTVYGNSVMTAHVEVTVKLTRRL